MAVELDARVEARHRRVGDAQAVAGVAADGDAVVDGTTDQRALAAADGQPVDAAAQPFDAPAALDGDSVDGMLGIGHGTIMARVAARAPLPFAAGAFGLWSMRNQGNQNF